MKKVIFAIALMTFVGTVATTAYAASTHNGTEIKKDDKKKKSKKKGSCCSAQQGASSCAKPGTEGAAKSCCQGKK